MAISSRFNKTHDPFEGAQIYILLCVPDRIVVRWCRYPAGALSGGAETGLLSV